MPDFPSLSSGVNCVSIFCLHFIRMKDGLTGMILFRQIAALLLWALVVVPQALAAETAPALTGPEERLAEQVGMDKDVLLTVREEARNDLHRMVGYNDKGYQILADGVVVSVSRNRTEAVLRSLREKLHRRNCLVFVIELNDAIKRDKIGVMKGADQFSILQVMYTNGDEDDVSHEEVVERLKVWEKKSPFDIIGAENDWVEIEFRTLPPDLKSFAEEVYDFSPDAIDEGAGSIAELMKQIVLTRRLLLFWN